MNNEDKTTGEELNNESITPFLYIPNYINDVKDLKAAERDVLAVIEGLSKKDGFCFVKNETLTQVARVKSVRGIQYILKKLKDRKLIYVDIARYKKSEIKEGKSRYGTVRKISPLIGNIKKQVFDYKVEGDEKSFMGVANNPSLNIVKSDSKPNYNYLSTQKSISDKENFRNSNLIPLSKSRNEVVIRSMLNKIRNNKVYKWVNNSKHFREIHFDFAKYALIYYINVYKRALHKDHPRYKHAQLEECYTNFARDIEYIERIDGVPIDEIRKLIPRTIERWFSTSPKDENYLLLSHFIGGLENEIFINSMESVWSEND